MGELIILKDWKAKKKTNDNAGIKQVMKDSLDNKKVMQRYNIEQPTEEERLARIKNSIDRINQLMSQLRNGEGDR